MAVYRVWERFIDREHLIGRKFGTFSLPFGIFFSLFCFVEYYRKM